MGREQCMMCEVHGGKIYCGYYDAFYMLCEEEEHCPEDLDDDEIDDGYYEDDDFDEKEDFYFNEIR